MALGEGPPLIIYDLISYWNQHTFRRHFYIETVYFRFVFIICLFIGTIKGQRMFLEILFKHPKKSLKIPGSFLESKFYVRSRIHHL